MICKALTTESVYLFKRTDYYSERDYYYLTNERIPFNLFERRKGLKWERVSEKRKEEGKRDQERWEPRRNEILAVHVC